MLEILTVLLAVLGVLVPIILEINKVFITRKEIRRNLQDGINYNLNNKREEARKEFSNALKYEDNRFCRRLLINIKINFYETYHHDKIDREKSLEYARVNEEILIKKIPNYIIRGKPFSSNDEVALIREDKINYEIKKSIKWSSYKYQSAILYSNLGNVYNELALIRNAKDNYNHAKKNLIIAIEILKNIKNLNDYYLGVLSLAYSNLSITYRGLGNIHDDNSLLQLALNYAEKSLIIYEKIKDDLNTARLHNNIGNIYINFNISKQNNMEINYDKGVEHLSKSLDVYTIEKYPFEFARTHLNLGVANYIMMIHNVDKNIANTYFLKAEGNYNACQNIFTKDKYCNEYISINYNLMTLNCSALIKFNDINLLKKIFGYSKNVFEICTINSNPKRYIDTKGILAATYKNILESFVFENIEFQIEMLEEAIANYEIILSFRRLNINGKGNIMFDLIRLYMTLLDITGLKKYEEKCKYYSKEFEKIIQAYPEVMDKICDDLLKNLNIELYMNF